jgi:phosphogluconate dehydratase
MPLNPVLIRVTERLRERSRASRAAYLARMRAAASDRPPRTRLACGNLAHGFAACGEPDKARLSEGVAPNLGIVTAYNDMLSAHQPFEGYPALLRAAARAAGGSAQVAGGVPAMCDGVTQGQAGMELSLFSRDLIAMSTAVALSHQMFDGALYLGVCDKIVPGLLIGALRFGHLPGLFVPAGPMPSGISNDQKSAVRKRFADGKAGRDELLAAEAASYHAPGTCTFYGTANSNQMLMELMGLHLPGGTFVAPGTPLRRALTEAAAARLVAMCGDPDSRPIGEIVDERCIVNAVVGLLATGGSTNHALHLPAIARAAGIRLDWDDLSALSAVVPLLARVYPNGSADVNALRDAGGLGVLIGELLDAGLLHEDVETVAGRGLSRYRVEASVDAAGALSWAASVADSGDRSVLRGAAQPFEADGGLKLVEGPLGRAVIKTSAVPADRRRVSAPARVFSSQEAVIAAFKAGELDRDVIVVLRFQGPRANGMPELHSLTPALSVLQDRGHRVALVTDGRMSGASGKVPAAIHCSPEALLGGGIGKVRDGDWIQLDADGGRLDVLVEAAEWEARALATADTSANDWGVGRELLRPLRGLAAPAEQGGGVLRFEVEHFEGQQLEGEG